MQKVQVTDRVWDKILSARAGTGCFCPGSLDEFEKQALALYGALVQPKKDRIVFAQIGQSLDGRVATVSGDANGISDPDGFAHLHRLRALADAVIIGVKTALHDDPQLTVRLAEETNPARVVIDPNGRLPNDVRLLNDCGTRRIIIQTVDKLRPPNVEVIRLQQAKWIAPQDILDALTGLGLKRIMIEGGGITIAQFLEANLLDRLHVSVAPMIIGSGLHSLTTPSIATLAMAHRPPTDIYNLGSDILFDCALSLGDDRAKHALQQTSFKTEAEQR